MANRALLAKLDRATTQRRELGAVETGKDFYLYAHHYEKPVSRDELAVLCAGKKITKCTTTRTVVKTLRYGNEVISVEREVSNAGYARGARKGKGAGTCERRLWIGKPPRI